MDPVDPSVRLEPDPDILARFPLGYRHLTYLQDGLGYPVNPDMPGIDGSVVERLYADATDGWKVRL